MTFTYASLFSGIGGFEQAINPLGGVCVFASEIDKHARKSYTALYGDEHLHGDITEIPASNVPDHDLLVAGFPCQSFSVSGHQRGFYDSRGTLFFDIARIAIEKQPKVLLLENVKGLVNHDGGNTLDTMVRVLNDTGYVIDFTVLNSKFFGVPQNRERIFIIAIRSDLIESEEFTPSTLQGSTVLARGRKRIGEWADTFNFKWPAQEGASSSLRDVLESNVDEGFRLSSEHTQRLLAELEGELGFKLLQRGRGSNPGGVLRGVPSLTSSGWEHNNHLIEPVQKAVKVGNVNPSGKGMNGVVYDADNGLSLTLTTNKGEGVKVVHSVDRKVKRQNGPRFKNGESSTLTTQDRHGVFTKENGEYIIRRLTPLECFRLQAFPDDAHHAIKEAGVSNAQMYKQIGNAVTVSVVKAIVAELVNMKGVIVDQ